MPISSQHFKVFRLMALCLIQLCVCGVAHCQSVLFREDFNDSHLPPVMLTDQPPSQIDAGIQRGIHETRDGSHFLRSNAGEHVFTRISDLAPPHSIEVQARLTTPVTGNGEFISVGVMNDYGDEFYWGGIYADGRGAAGWATFDQFVYDEDNEKLVDSLDWFKLRLDVDDDELSLWAWPATTDRPELPTMTYPTDRFDETELTTAFIDWNGPNSGTQPWLEVDYIEVTALRELAGDLNRDRTLDATDIDLLTETIQHGEDTESRFDMNQDDKVDIGDHHHWVVQLKSTWIGDANLDGEFNSTDFVTVFQSGKYETDELARWTEGDWNADQRFNSSDFVAAFQDGGYEVGPRVAASPVPEPPGGILLFMGMIGLGALRRRPYAIAQQLHPHENRNARDR